MCKFYWISSNLYLSVIFLISFILISFYGGDPKSFYYGHSAFLAFQAIIGIRSILFQSNPDNRAIVQHFLEPLMLFDNRITCEQLRISHDAKIKLEKQALQLYKMSRMNVITFCFQWFTSSTVMILWKFDWQRSPFVAILSLLHYWLFIFFGMAAQCIGLTYFYILCKVCEAKIDYLKKELVTYKTYSLITHVKLLIRHHDVFRSVAMYNQYWKYYISAMIGSFVPLVSLVAYMAFVADNPLPLKIAFMVMCPGFLTILSFVVLCAAKVSKELISTHRQLLKLNNHVLASKKNQVQWILTKIRRIKRVLTRFELPVSIGFSCGDLFYIDYNTYVNVSKNFVL